MIEIKDLFLVGWIAWGIGGFDIADLFLGGWIVWGLGGWIMYLREDEYRRDVLADLLQLIHDRDLDRGDLRRSLGYDEIEERLDRDK